MRTLIVLGVGLLAVGCATMKDIGVYLGVTGPKASNKNKSTIVETPTKVTLPQGSLPPLPGIEITPEQDQKTLRDSVVGEYEMETAGYVFLKNGTGYFSDNGRKGDEFKWSCIITKVTLLRDGCSHYGEIHINGGGTVLRINWTLVNPIQNPVILPPPKESITPIASIDNDGKRTAFKVFILPFLKK